MIYENVYEFNVFLVFLESEILQYEQNMSKNIKSRENV